ncbi:MAG: hypothetical protein ACD_49C00093G0005 [uncultured bacterium (gcode 4)]|uniref:Uncharacterized protein n=1 Tax=uncultured bacterium (gcode 4) TaxID=1234023 RepID=K2BU74_9BACT|nr:MAG: hypothetical protein ACD_49C00093G0005 [uncultured bacterium (gcode 4)]
MTGVKNNLPPLPNREDLSLPKNSPERMKAEEQAKVAYEARYANASLAEKARLMLARSLSGELAASIQFDLLAKK